jgi:ribosome-associated protein
MLFVTPELNINEAEFEFSYVRSSGPGGQNVNKVNSKAVLRWLVVESDCLPLGVRVRFLEKFGNQLTTEGALVITSDRFRDQTMNREDCLNKLREMLAQVARPPKPRKKTKPSRSAKKKRMQKKREHGEKKRFRGRVRAED